MILTLLSGDEVYLCKSCFRHVEFGGRPCLLDNQILELFHNWRTQVVLMMLVSGGISPFWAGTDIATQRRVVSDYLLFVLSFSVTIYHEIMGRVFPLKKWRFSITVTSPVQSGWPCLWSGIQQLKGTDKKVRVSYYSNFNRMQSLLSGCWCWFQRKDWQPRQFWLIHGLPLTTRQLSLAGEEFRIVLE